jgi:ElaA protein
MSRDTLTWSELAPTELDVATLYDVMVLRSEVFVVEQRCAYLDLDGLDLLDGTCHLLGRTPDAGRIAAYARVLAPDDEHPTPRIGRVIVAGAARGQQVGRELMRRALGACERRWPGEPVELGAQAHLAGFYRSLGFQALGEPYDEDGIAHVHMRREE